MSCGLQGGPPHGLELFQHDLQMLDQIVTWEIWRTGRPLESFSGHLDDCCHDGLIWTAIAFGWMVQVKRFPFGCHVPAEHNKMINVTHFSFEDF